MMGAEKEAIIHQDISPAAVLSRERMRTALEAKPTAIARSLRGTAHSRPVTSATR